MSAAAKNLYSILQVPQGADQDTIKKAYRKLMLQWHPDKHKNSPESEKRSKEIIAAYEILGNREKRAAYNCDGMPETIFARSARAATVKPYDYYQYSEMLGPDTAWGKDPNSKEPVYYLFIPKRQETAARAALRKIGMTAKKLGMVCKDVEVNGATFVAVGFTNYFMNEGDIIDFEGTWGFQPRLAKVQGEREGCMGDFLADPRIQKMFANIENQSTFRPTFNKVVVALRALYERNNWGGVNDRMGMSDNVTEGRNLDIEISRIYDKDLQKKIVGALRKAGFRAGQDFSISDVPPRIKGHCNNIVISYQSLSQSPALADDFLTLAEHPDRKLPNRRSQKTCGERTQKLLSDGKPPVSTQGKS